MQRTRCDYHYTEMCFPLCLHSYFDFSIWWFKKTYVNQNMTTFNLWLVIIMSWWWLASWHGTKIIMV